MKTDPSKTTEKISIDHYPITLIQLLKLENLVESGGVAKQVVEDGLVMVNGQVEFRKRRQLQSGDQITFMEQQIRLE